MLKSKRRKGWAGREAPAQKSRRLNKEQGTDSTGWPRGPATQELAEPAALREPIP